METYIIGDAHAPWWCKKSIMPYMKSDGSTGYEYHSRKGILRLKKGDMLIKGHNSKDVFIRRKG